MPVVIEGLKELSDRLEAMPRRAAKRYINKVVDPSIQVVEQALHETVPVGIGILEEMIVHKKSFEDENGSTTLTVEIGPARKAFWGMFQEFGTQFQQGQHWMGRAWEGCKNRCLYVFATEATALLMDLGNKD